MSAKYQQLADEVIDLLGGKDNVASFTHCLTRLRFNVKNQELVDGDRISKIEGVLGTNWAPGPQLQLIIGTTVVDAYNLVSERNGLSKQPPVDENLDGAKAKKSPLDQVIDVMTGCFGPIVPLLMAVGLLKVILLLCTLLHVMSSSDQTYQVLSFCADAGFYFLPIFVAGTTALHFGGNLGLGFILGAILLHPTYTAAYADSAQLSLFGIPVFMANYSSTVFPSVIAVFLMCRVQKFFGKISPDILRPLIEPLATMLVMIPLTILLIAPLGSMLGTVVSQTIVGIYETVGFLGVSIMCCLYPILVLTGMHRMFMPYQLQSFSSLGYEPFYIPSAFVSNLNQGVASAVVAIKAKNSQKTRTLAASSALTAVVAGVTEPAMYGITTRFKKAMLSALVGNFVGGAVAGLFSVVCYAYPGTASIFGLAAFLGDKGAMNVVFLLVAMAVGALVTFVVGMAIIKPEEIN